MIFLDIDNDFSKSLIDNVNNSEMQDLTAEERMQLIAKATLDKRLNARDLKLYNYIICYEYLGFTQEEISELLDLSRSNINKSLEKLAAFNYIEKNEIKVEGETRKKMTYIPKGLGEVGFIGCSADSIIRVLNVSNVADSKLKYNYCTIEEVKNYELLISDYKGYIDTIDEDYDSESEHVRKNAYELVEAFSPALNEKDDAIRNLKSSIEDFSKKISDTKSMSRKLAQFSRSLKSNVLDAKAVQEVLANKDAKLILFLDRAEDENFDNFREKYLEDYIRFVCAFSDLAENENFFKLYYENKKIEMTCSEIIKMLGFVHREVPHMRKGAINSIMESFEKFLDDFKKLELSQRAKGFIDEVSDLYEDGLATDGVYNSREIAIILYVLDKRRCMKHLGLSYGAFLELYNPEISGLIEELEKLNPTLFETKISDVKAKIELEKTKEKLEDEC